MAKLEIKVTGLDQLRAPGASSGAAVGADLARQLRVQGQLAERIARSLRTSIDGISTQLNGIGQTLTQSLSRSAVASAQAFNQNFVQNVQNNVTNISASYQQSMFVAIRNTERQALASSRRIAAAVGAAGRAFSSVGRGVGGGIAGAGSALGGGIGGLFGGGLGLSGLVRGAGGLASGVFGGAGRAAAGITGGIGGAVSGGLGLIPGIGPLLGGISSGITSAVAGGLQAAASVGSGVLDAATNLATSITSKLVSVIQVGLVAGLVLAVSSVAKASEFQRISGAFDGIAKSIGTDATTALQGFRTATRGTISDVELLTQANRAVILGAVTSQEEFERLASSAVRLGRATGRDAASALEDLTLGLARQSKLLLDNLGIIVDVEGAYQKLAASTGRTTAQLTDSEKRLAFQTEAYRAIDSALEKLGPAQRDYGEVVEQLGAAFSNLQVQIGSALLPILTRITPELTRIVEGIRQWLTDNNVQIAAALTSALEGIPSILGRISGFIEGNSLASAFIAAQRAIESLVTGADQALRALGATLRGEIRAAIEAAEFAVGDLGSNALRRAGDVGVNAVLRGPGALADLAFGTTPRTFGTRDSTGAANASIDAIRAQASAEAAQALQGAVSPIEAFTRGLQAANEQLGTRNGLPPGIFTTPPVNPLGAGLGFGLNPGAGGPRPPSAEAISGARANLASLGIIAEELPPAAQSLIESILASDERIKNVREAAEEQIATSLSRSLRLQLDGEQDRGRAIDEELRERERQVDRTRDILGQINSEFAQAADELGAGLADSVARIRASAAAAEDQARADVAGRVTSRADQLAGAGGGLDGISLPLNVFKAIEDVRRQRSKQVFEGLRQATAGLSSSDLAANDGALLQQVLRGQAERDVGSREALFSAIDAIATREREEIRAVETDYSAALTRATDSYEAALNDAAIALEAGVAAFERLSVTNEEFRSRISRLESQIERVERLERLARS